MLSELSSSILVGHFTPGHAALGGLLLGVAACAQLLLNGRVLGISGAIKGLFLPPTPGAAAGCDAAGGRAEFVVGMLSASALLGVVAPAAFLPLPHASYSVGRALVAGVLVGLGTALGNGCTSGHGICGLARLSLRSLAYTLTFMASGAVVATLAGTAAAAGVNTSQAATLLLPGPAVALIALGFASVSVAVFAALVMMRSRPDKRQKAPASANRMLESAAAVVVGATAAAGLMVSGMVFPGKVAAFLSPLLPAWDASLALVMASALVPSTLAFQAVLGRLSLLPKCMLAPEKGSAPLIVGKYSLPTSSVVDSKLLLGALLFGAGWGLSGVCPGPALVAVAGSFAATLAGAAPLSLSLASQILPYVVGMLVGFWVEPMLTLD